MKIPPETIARYQRGGDIYGKLVAQYGTTGANRIAAAAASGDRPTLTEALGTADRGPAYDESTLSIFTGQIVTDPLAAPLDGANDLLGNSFASLFRNKWVLLILILVAFFAFGGGPWLAKRVFK
jgi:hypothetical protein